MLTLDDQVLLKAGDAVSFGGQNTTITLQDLHDIANSYDIALQEAFICLGHTSDPLFSQDAEAEDDKAPAMGWVKALKVSGNELLGRLELTEKLRALLRGGYYRYKSVAFYPEGHANNPKKGIKYLRHLAVLGAKPPAFKGLGAIIAYSEPSIMEDKAQEIREVLIEVLTDGTNGYKGLISAFEPEPDESNNYLFDEAKGQFSGVFKDGIAEFDFTITKAGDGWESSYVTKMPDGFAEDAEPEEADETGEAGEADETEAETSVEPDEQDLESEIDVYAEPDEADTDADAEQETEVAEEPDQTVIAESQAEPTEQTTEADLTDEPDEIDPQLEELERLRAENAKLKAQAEAMEQAEISSFCEQAYTLGKMVPSILPKADLLNLLNALSKAKKTAPLAAFGEGTKEAQQVDVLSGLMKLITNLQPVVAFGESDESAKKPGKTKQRKYATPAYSQADAGQLGLHEKAMAYCEANGLDANKSDQYTKAVKAVS